MPLVALPSRTLPGVHVGGSPSEGVLLGYLHALSRMGCECVILPPQPLLHRDHRLALCHGLLLPGGADLAPITLRGAGRDSVHDEHEAELIRCAIELELPVLAICRGMQLLNRTLGGTIRPLSDDTSLAHHRTRWSDGERYGHDVRVLEGSLLHKICGCGSTVSVNGNHRWQVADLAPRLSCSAWSDDGVVEAIELRSRHDILAVQWHPEALLCDEDAASLAIFEWFAQACRTRAMKGGPR